MHGMSGIRMRHLYNNLCSFEGCRCLQIGIWTGSSVFAALAGNVGCSLSAVDNWSEFGGPKEEFAAAAEELLTGDERRRLQVWFFGLALEGPVLVAERWWCD